MLMSSCKEDTSTFDFAFFIASLGFAFNAAAKNELWEIERKLPIPGRGFALGGTGGPALF